MMSSLRISAVKEIETICKNSFSKRTRDMIMIADPEVTLKNGHSEGKRLTHLGTS